MAEASGILLLSSYLLFLVCCVLQCEGQQQYFIERPQNVSVRQGETAYLRCRVGYQQGRSQWTKDGLALGFERNIPGYPRYSVTGDHSSGEHILRIDNATLEDDAEYQCQVGPRGNQKPIRADALLTVLIAPTSLEIQDHREGGRIDVRENEEYSLTCVVRNAKPAAEIVWFKRNKQLQIPAEVSTTDGDLPRRSNTQSKITVRAQADDNEAEYTCEARHAALSIPKRTSVFFSVQYPPGPPEIIGYSNGETVRMGQEVTLVCISRGGNPLAQVVWYKNDVKVDFSYTTSGRESRNTYIFTAEGTDNNAKFRCEASNPLSPAPMKTEVTLVVHFPPKTVTITGPNEAKVGDTVSLGCTTSNSNPEARLSWVLDGRPQRENGSSTAPSPNGGWVSSANLTTVVRSSERNLTVSCYAVVHELGQTIVDTKVISVVHPPQKPVIYGLREEGSIREGSLIRLTCISMGGNPLATLKWYQAKKELKSEYSVNGNVASAKLELTAKRDDNGKDIRCEATNPALESPLSETAVLQIEFPPTRVSVKGRTDKLRPGQTATLTCESASSNPVSRLSWWKGGSLIAATSNSTQSGPFQGTVSKSTLQLEVVPDLDDAVYTCQATNDILGQSVHDAVTLEVLYKPQFIQPADYSIDAEEGKSAVVNMTVRSNPQNVTFAWSRDGWPIRPGAESQPGERIFYSDGVLHLTSVKRDDAGNFRCNATNAEGTTTALVKINVLYAASIAAAEPHILVSEGADAFLECRAAGNPLTKDTVKWRRADYDMDARTEQATDVGVAYLTVKQVTRSDYGAFECVANNGIGEETVQKTWLVVKYEPVMDESPEYQKAAGDEGQVAKIVCRASGAPNISFTWTREGVSLTTSTDTDSKYSSSIEQIDLTTWQSILSVRDVQSRDYGTYDCIARNELGFHKTTVTLSGTSRPDPPLALNVINVTHDAVDLSWKPGFDGGLAQSYRIRYKKIGTEFFKYADVHPPNATSFVLSGLSLDTEFLLSIMAFNERGGSNYTEDIVKARTLAEAPPSAQRPRDLEVRPGEMPKMLIIVITMVGTSLLVLNVALIACFVRRRHRRRIKKVSIRLGDVFQQVSKVSAEAWNETSSAATQTLDTPQVIIIAVSSSVCLLLLVNVTIITCYLLRKQKHRKQNMEAMSSEGGSSKSATIEMYAPSSYNETVIGETMSSISEKSESYSQSGSNSDFTHEDTSKPAVSTYLMDRSSEPQTSYGSYRMSQGTIPRQSKTVNFDMSDDNYIDTRRRNVYHHSDEPYDPHYAATPRSDTSRYVPYPKVASFNIPAASMEFADPRAHYSGPSLATIRSLETEGHLV